MSYYISFSFLSNNKNVPKAAKKALLGTEARRILSAFENRPIGENDIEKNENGRPFFPHIEADFNISHSGSLCAVSYVQGKKLRTGCDVEEVRPRKRLEEIAEIFSIEERDYILSDRELCEKRFYEIWTLKESLLKLHGLSVFDIKSVPSFINDKGMFSFCSQDESPLCFSLYELSFENSENYPSSRFLLASAVEGTREEPEIRCFSQLSFDCKKIAQINAAPNPAVTVRPNM